MQTVLALSVRRPAQVLIKFEPRLGAKGAGAYNGVVTKLLKLSSVDFGDVQTALCRAVAQIICRLKPYDPQSAKEV